jgi:hypothetical protein
MTETPGTTRSSSVTESQSPVTATEAVRTRVSVSPVPGWVIKREIDESSRALGAGPHSVLLLDQQRRFGEDAHFERLVRRVETLQAAQEASHWRLDFDPATQRVELHTLAVQRDGQSFEHAHSERIRLLQREANLERHMLDESISLVVLLDDVRVGDIIETSFTVRTETRLLRDRHWYFSTVPSAVAIRAFHLRILFPEGVPMQWKCDLPEAAPTERRLPGETEWSWTVENTVAVEAEPDVPGWYIPSRWFQVSDFPSWGDLSGGLLAAWREEFSAPELDSVSEQMAADAENLATIAQRAITFVQDEIRYLSCNEDFARQIPSAPASVLQRRFGNCKDKAFLLVHLLRRLGVPARPVLVHSQMHERIASFLPNPDAFDHVIVEYEIDDERGWCDPSLRLQGGDALGRAIPRFGLGLPLGPGVTNLEPITSPERVRHALEIHEAFYLDTSGRASVMTVLITATGLEADHLRSSLALEGAEAVARSRDKLYREFFPDLKRAGELEWRDYRERMSS